MRLATGSSLRAAAAVAATPALLLLACLAAAGVDLASGHGMVIKPISRQYQSYLYDPMDKKSWSPAECNAGGPKVVSDGYRLQWPAGKWDFCGDPLDSTKKHWNYMRYIAETYKSGEVIPVHQLVTANHEGRVILRLCPANATSENYEEVCVKLPRHGCKGSHCVHWTMPPGGGLDAKKRPLIPAYEHRSFAYYIYTSSDDFNLLPVYLLHYKLPDGFKCDHCILHWYWLTGNTCNPPGCDRSDHLYPNCNRKLMGFCGETNRPDKYPEEFWTCSDIRIV